MTRLRTRKPAGRDLKTNILSILQSEDFQSGLEGLIRLPARQAVNPLFSFLLHKEERVRWRAAVAMGAVVEAMAQTDMEGARVVMRRLMWSLNDESGGIGWGAPESMAEILVRHDALAHEFGPVFLSYLDERGNFLEYENLQRGLLWGLARVAQARPPLAKPAAAELGKYLGSADATVRGLAALSAGILRADKLRDEIAALLSDDSEVRFFLEDKMVMRKVKDLASEALSILDAQTKQRPAKGDNS
jgi:HEAT repeat protein